MNPEFVDSTEEIQAQVAESREAIDALVAGDKWYVICCRECDGDGKPLPIPFETPEERGRWASEHKRGTGHDRWFVIDQSRTHDG